MKILNFLLLLGNFLSLTYAEYHKDWIYKNYFNVYNNDELEYKVDLIKIRELIEKDKLNIKSREQQLLGMFYYIFNPAGLGSTTEYARILESNVNLKNKEIELKLLLKLDEIQKKHARLYAISFFAGLTKGFCYENIISKLLIDYGYKLKLNIYIKENNKNKLVYNDIISNKLCLNIKSYINNNNKTLEYFLKRSIEKIKNK